MSIFIEKAIREKFLSFYPESVRPLLEAALPEFELQAARLAMEVLYMEGQGAKGNRLFLNNLESVRRFSKWQ